MAPQKQQGPDLKEYSRQEKKYGAGGVKELENGRFRFYGGTRPAKTPGEMIGSRFVREWDPATGNTRNWNETLDSAGRVRSVAPKPVTEPMNHRIFDAEGKYLGRR
jgi:filamentous hemagglutinin